VGTRDRPYSRRAGWVGLPASRFWAVSGAVLAAPRRREARNQNRAAVTGRGCRQGPLAKRSRRPHTGLIADGGRTLWPAKPRGTDIDGSRKSGQLMDRVLGHRHRGRDEATAGKGRAACSSQASGSPNEALALPRCHRLPVAFFLFGGGGSVRLAWRTVLPPSFTTGAPRRGSRESELQAKGGNEGAVISHDQGQGEPRIRRVGSRTVREFMT